LFFSLALSEPIFNSMHKERIFVLAGSGIGVLSAFLTWRTVKIFGFGRDFSGIDHWTGWFSIAIFAVIATLALIGNRERAIEAGAQKIIILVSSSLLSLLFLVLIILHISNSFDSPGIGLFLSLMGSAACLIMPLVTKDSGEIAVPSMDEIIDEIKDSAEVMEDQVEDIGDKIEDKVEDIADKIEDKFDKDKDD
jgi:hypothetical protein